MKEYPLQQVHFVYNEDGSFILPFVYNNTYTKVKTLPDEKCFEIKTLIKPNGKTETTEEALRRTIFNEFNIENNHLCLDNQIK
jgi:hypothetical protein